MSELGEAADLACRALDAAIGAAECGYVPSKSVQQTGREAAIGLRSALRSGQDLSEFFGHEPEPRADNYGNLWLVCRCGWSNEGTSDRYVMHTAELRVIPTVAKTEWSSDLHWREDMTDLRNFIREDS